MSVYYPYIQSLGPSLWWRLNETSGTSVADASGNGYTGVVFGFPTFGQPSLSPPEQVSCMGFDGATTFLRTVPFPGIVGSVSFECWYNPTSLATTQSLLANGLVSHIAGWRSLTVVSGTIFWTCTDDSGSDVTVSSLAVLSTGHWYHVVGTIDSTAKTVALYVNGVLQGTSSTPNTFTSKQNRFWAASNNQGLQVVNGLMDEVVVYPFTLSQLQVSSLFYKAQLLVPPAPAPVPNDTQEVARIRKRLRWYACQRCGQTYPENMVIVQRGVIVCQGPNTNQCHDHQGYQAHRRRLRLPIEVKPKPLPVDPEDL